ncbi:MAG: hypothetical protein AAF468_17480 [Pseudomonadota bacterium]
MNSIFKSFLAASFVSTLAVSAASAADFSKGSKAKEWGLAGEEKATFSGKVVDILCELSGDCADNCGNGHRNLGIVRSGDNKLIAVLKNRQASFNGAAEDLLPYCNKQVDVDGVLIGEDEVVKTKFYMVQFIRESGAEKWNKASLWTKRWKAKNPDAKGKGPWFRRDPRVKKQIAATGHFGLGKEVDQKYIEENE